MADDDLFIEGALAPAVANFVNDAGHKLLQELATHMVSLTESHEQVAFAIGAITVLLGGQQMETARDVFEAAMRLRGEFESSSAAQAKPTFSPGDGQLLCGAPGVIGKVNDTLPIGTPQPLKVRCDKPFAHKGVHSFDEPAASGIIDDGR
jgi:hypothetical protein